jgi:plastocyanin
MSLVILAISAPLAAQTDHPVTIGPGGFRLAFSDNLSGTNITFVNPGDTVTWTWFYLGIEHSTTSAVCTPTVPGSCPPNGIWDSDFKFFSGTPPNPTFTRTFNSLGTFPYFCKLHGEPDGMRGQVVVTNGPDFALDLTSPNSSTTFGTFSTSTIAAVPMQFSTTNNSSENSKLVAGFGYNSPVTLSCQNGAPDTCPGFTVVPTANGSTTITSSNFPVTNSTFGDFNFDIVATGSDPNHITHAIQHVLLHVTDFNLTPLSVNSVQVSPGQTSQPITFQVAPSPNGFSGSINLSCSGLPVGAFCAFSPSSFVNLFGGFPQSVSLSIHNTNAVSGRFQVNVQGAFQFFNNGLFQTVFRSQPLTVVTGPTHFGLIAPSTVIAGSPFSVTASALDNTQQVVTGYTGTVQFTSSDGAATLPANFTFTGPNQGTHTFTNGVTLKTFGSQTVTVKDATLQINGTAPISVIPADHLGIQISAAAQLPAGTEVISGTPFNITVSALDIAGNVVPQYGDTIHFSSSDASIAASLPADYTFTGLGKDNGTHTFNLVLNKIEPITISITDLSFAGLGATTPQLLVVPATGLKIQVLPGTSVDTGSPFSIVVTAADAAGNPVPQFTDTIHFTISDGAASGALPGDYTFTGTGIGNDNGVHSFGITLNKIEPIIITVTDVSFPGLSTTTPVILVGNSAFNGSFALSSSRNGQAPPHFAVGANAAANGALTFTATVTLNSGDPAGSVHFFDGTQDLGEQPLSAAVSGTATAILAFDGVTAQLRPGYHIITAVYEPTSGTGSLAVMGQPRSPAPRCNTSGCP